MNCIKKTDGFTLIEVITVINISFITISMIIGFYLLMSKYVFNYTRILNERAFISLFLLRINESLKKADDYFFVAEENNVFIMFSDKKKIIFEQESINVFDHTSIEGISYFELKFTLFNSQEIIYTNSTDSIMDIIISSSDIKYIDLKIIVRNCSYSMKFITSASSAKRFPNKHL